MSQIYDMGPTALLPLRRKACLGFFRSKNPTFSTRFEPANLGTKVQHATPRTPKAMIESHNHNNCCWAELHCETTVELFGTASLSVLVFVIQCEISL